MAKDDRREEDAQLPEMEAFPDSEDVDGGGTPSQDNEIIELTDVANMERKPYAAGSQHAARFGLHWMPPAGLPFGPSQVHERSHGGDGVRPGREAAGRRIGSGSVRSKQRTNPENRGPAIRGNIT